MINTVKQIHLSDGTKIPAFGQGTWFMGEQPHQAVQEIMTLQLGIDQGLTLIDTAEMYAEGGAEKIVGKAIAGRRQDIFLVSKVLPYHADLKGTCTACENSLSRLNTDVIDLYLLHWPGSIPLSETVAAMETLIQQGKIRYWGVSNFDVADLEELAPMIKHHPIYTNQVLYNLSRRGIEFDLLPYCRKRNLPVMAYPPIEQGRILNNHCLQQIAKSHGATPAQIALAWLLQNPDIIVIPKSSSRQHMLENIQSLSLTLTAEDRALLDLAFPPPVHKTMLEML